MILTLDKFSQYDLEFFKLLKNNIKENKTFETRVIEGKAFKKFDYERMKKMLGINSIGIIKEKLNLFVSSKIIRKENIGKQVYVHLVYGENTMILKRRICLPKEMRKDYEEVVSAFNNVITHDKGYRLYPYPFEKHEKYVKLFRDVTEFLVGLLYRNDGSRRTISLRLLAMHYFSQYKLLTRSKKYKLFRMQLMCSKFVKKNFLEWVVNKDTTVLNKKWLKETSIMIKEMEASYKKEVEEIKEGKFSFIKEFLIDDSSRITEKEKVIFDD